MKIVMFNLPFSHNLGDRLIADCMAAELRAIDPSLDLVTADLAGRVRPNEGRSKRRFIFALLDRMPAGARKIITGVALRRLARRLRPAWRAKLIDADAAVIGGGNLFSDQDLNFPVKIHAALDCSAKLGVPAAVYAAGVSPGWSRAGEQLFASGLGAVKLVHAAVRDRASQAEWASRLGPHGIGPAILALDPAIFAASHFPASERTDGTIGLCITSPGEILYHASERMDVARVEQWFVTVAATLAQKGYTVIFFTTGNPADEIRLKALEPRLLAATAGMGRVAPTPSSTKELTTLLSGFQAVIAHRLHACITAYAYGIPSVGLVWDAKIRGFFDMIGYPERAIDTQGVSPDNAVGLLEIALKDGYDERRRAANIDRARADIARLLTRLQSEVGDSNSQ